MNWFEKLFRHKKKNHTQAPQGAIDPVVAKKMLVMIEKTEVNELSCDEVHALLDQYTEMKLRGEDADALLPLVHHHLEMCPDCKEEHEALLRVLEGTNAL